MPKECDFEVSPGMVIEVLANHIASLKSKLGNTEEHQIGNALSGRKRYLLERIEEADAIAADIGLVFRDRVSARVELLLKD